MFQAAIVGNHGIEPGIGSAVKQLAVLDPRPVHVRGGKDLVAGQFQANLVREVFIEQQLHAGTATRSTSWRIISSNRTTCSRPTVGNCSRNCSMV